MSDPIPTPSALTEEAVAGWLFHLDYPRRAWEEADAGHIDTYLACARAVLALVEAKVREGVVKRAEEECFTPATIDNLERIVARVMGREVAP